MTIQSKPIAIGCDHTAVDFKKELIGWMEANGYAVRDCGSFASDSSDDYPDTASLVCGEVSNGSSDLAVLICGTGIGMSMAANKVPGIRAAVCDNCYCAKYTRLHNDANVLCLGARTTGVELAKMILEYFLTTGFEGGRHQRRVDKINALDERGTCEG